MNLLMPSLIQSKLLGILDLGNNLIDDVGIILLGNGLKAKSIRF
jgi:hypothetical protein